MCIRDRWYGGWWDAGFWGPYWGGGWYYPYPVTYSYDTGTLIMEMVDLRQPVDQSNQNKLPVIWHAYASGLLYGNSHFNLQLTCLLYTSSRRSREDTRTLF